MKSKAGAASTLFSPIAANAVRGPLYREVKRELLLALESGRLVAGTVLPSEFELGRVFGVSIGTVRHAVDELVAEHIVVRRQGIGTFVAVHNAERFLFQFFHVERTDGLHELPLVELVSYQRERMSEEAACALGARAGEPAIVIENRLRLQGRPVVYDHLTLPALLYKGLSEKRFRERPSTIYHLYQTEFGITVTQAHERARAVTASRAACRVLGLAAGTPVLEVRRTALTFGDKAVEYRISTLDTGHYDYVHTLSRSAV